MMNHICWFKTHWPKISLKENIISKDDLTRIENLRNMRNISAHTDQNHTEQQAENSLEFVKELLKR